MNKKHINEQLESSANISVWKLGFRMRDTYLKKAERLNHRSNINTQLEKHQNTEMNPIEKTEMKERVRTEYIRREISSNKKLQQNFAY